MTRRGARKSQGKPEDELAKRLFSGSQSENEPSPVKTSQKKTPKSSKKEKALRNSAQDDSRCMNEQKKTSAKTPGQAKKTATSKPGKKTPKPKASDVGGVGLEAVGSDGDDEVTFNFEARSGKNTPESLMTDVAEPESTSLVEENQVTVVPVSQKEIPKPCEEKSSTENVNPKSSSEVNNSDTAAMPTVQASASTEATEDLGNAAMENEEAAEEKQPGEEKGEEQSGTKRKSRKRKASHQQNEIPLKKSSKSDEDIFFYCGNLPHGVTSETLRYFLEEEGIHPKVRLNRMRTNDDRSIASLTPKQRQYKRNQMKAAKLFFATVIVKTEEEAKKMLYLNGINMPSPSNRDVDTELKIVRRLPRSDKFPYKVHIGGLHPRITEEELRHYLESRGIKPEAVVVIRNQKTRQSRRYGFVWFESVPEADKAVDLPEPFMRDRPLVIQHSFKKKFKKHF